MKYITVIPSLTLNQLFNSNNKTYLELDKPQHQSFQYGRDALWVGLELLGLGSGDEILIPAVLCDVVLKAVVVRGIRVHYYGLDSKLVPDVTEIETRIGPSTRAVYINHYFGRPTLLTEIRRLCNAKGIYLIEDCAHALAGSDGHIPLGSIGDISIFSYRKFLPVPDGGGLQVNIGNLQRSDSLPGASVIEMLYGAVKIMLLSMAEQGIIPIAEWKRVRGDIDGYLQADDNIDIQDWKPPHRMSSLSHWLISRANLRSLVERRRENYRFWMENMKNIPGVIPLYSDLTIGQVPFSFPVIVDNREKFIRNAAKRGVYLEPTLAPPFRNIENLVNRNERFPEIENISERLLSVPVHQSLTKEKLDYTLSAIRCGASA